MLTQKINEFFYPDSNSQFVKYLRYYEFYLNKGSHNIFDKIFLRYYRKCYLKYRYKIGAELYPNCAGPGLHLPHGKIVVNENAKIGANCKILSDVTIGVGGAYNHPGAPKIGNRVYIGSGAKIIGKVTIADDVVIGAGAIVVKDITESSITVAGNPAKKISNRGSLLFLNRM